MAHCCEMMSSYLSEGDIAIHYSAVVREYSITVLDGGGSGITMTFCPWCGKELPSSLRHHWFEELQAQGFDPGPDSSDPALPIRYRSDVWWTEAIEQDRVSLKTS